MSRSGVNLAVTEDGAAYNKLRRPDDYLTSLSAQHPPKSELPPVKRKFEAVETAAADDAEQPESKRSREVHTTRAGANNKKAFAGDTRRVFRPIKENGMQTMFPGLDDDGDDSSDEITKDALAYLRSVRSEASSIPPLLVAPPEAPKDDEHDRSMYNNGVGDHRVIYQDGTWVAVDADAAGGYYDEEEDWSQYSDDMDPQAAYYVSLLGRYQALRDTLAKADPEELASLVKANPEKYTDARVPYYKSDWRYAFDHRFPTPACVAQIDDKSVYRALEYLAEVLAIEDSISKQKSCWIWTLLAMAGDSGTLDYYKVGRIRELGHKAGQLSIRLRSGERRQQYRDDEEEGVEGWDVDGEGTDGEDDSELNADVDAQGRVPAPEEQRRGDEDAVNTKNTEKNGAIPTNLNDQSDGADEVNSGTAPHRATEEHENADTLMSEDEGEVHESKPTQEDEPADLEAARARLLAQLGDNLVTTSVPEQKVPPHQLRASQPAHTEPRQGGRHRHGGKVCHDLSCRKNKGRQEVHRPSVPKATQRNGQKGSSSATPSRPAPATRQPGTGQHQETHIKKDRAATSAEGLVYEELPAAAKSPPLSHNSDMDGALEQDGPLLEAAESIRQDADAGPDSTNNSDFDPDSEVEPANAVDLNTKVTIDMILTVVGECYGQRDLLRFREAW